MSAMALPQPSSPPLSSVLDVFDLSTERREVATIIDRNVLVLAGPGAGKTRLLAAHAVWLAEQQQGRVVLLTFSRNAAAELARRTARSVRQPAAARLLIATTIHGYALGLLQTHGYRIGLPADLTVIEAMDVERLGAEVAAELGVAAPEGIAREIEQYHRRGRWRAQGTTGPKDALVRRMVERMRSSGAIDWESCIRFATELLEGHPEVRGSIHHHDRFILLDEAQDCDPGLLALLDQIIGGKTGAHSFVVMDPDQSLYAFRDADPRAVVRWARGYEPVEVALTENFRCKPRIQALAKRILGRAEGGMSRDGSVSIWRSKDRKDEARFVHTRLRERLEGSAPLAPNRVAILARAAWRLDEIRAWLTEQGILLRAHPKLEWSSAEQEVLLALVFLSEWSEGDRASPKSFRFLRDGLGLDPTRVDELEQQSLLADRHPGDVLDDPRWISIRDWVVDDRRRPAEMVEEISVKLGIDLGEDQRLLRTATEARALGDLLRRVRQGSHPETPAPTEGVLVTTFHGAKGLEFETVFVVGCEDGVIPDWRAKDNERLSEERRALYVAVTRAASEVIVSWVAEDRGRTQSPSRFLPPSSDPIWSALDVVELVPR